MANKLKIIVFVVIGIVAIGLSIKCFSYDELDYISKSMYGGDAFTGIQNAAAITSMNVKELASIVQFGFGSILLITGLGFLVVALTTPIKIKSNDNNSTEATAKITEMSSESSEAINECIVNHDQ